MPAGIQHIGSHSDTADSATYAFQGINFGNVGQGDTVLVAVGSRQAGGTAALQSVTIAGKAATILGEIDSGFSPSNGVAIAAAKVTATSGEVVVNYASTQVRMAMHVARVSLVDIGQPLADTGAIAGTSAASQSVTVDHVKDGLLVAVGLGNPLVAGLSWSGASKLGSDLLVENQITVGYAAQALTADATGQLVTLTPASATALNLLAIVLPGLQATGGSVSNLICRPLARSLTRSAAKPLWVS